MANVARISSELEETRKSEEELKQKLHRLREQLAERRALRNRIASARQLVEADAKTVPRNVQETREPSEEFKEPENPPAPPTTSATTQKKGSWLSFFRARRRQQQGEEKRDQKQPMACRDADELTDSFSNNSDDSNNSFEKQQHHVEQAEQEFVPTNRFQKARGSWASFIPASRMKR